MLRMRRVPNGVEPLAARVPPPTGQQLKRQLHYLRHSLQAAQRTREGNQAGDAISARSVSGIASVGKIKFET